MVRRFQTKKTGKVSINDNDKFFPLLNSRKFKVSHELSLGLLKNISVLSILTSSFCVHFQEGSYTG